MVSCCVLRRRARRGFEGGRDGVAALFGAFEEEVFGGAIGNVRFCCAAEGRIGAQGSGEVGDGRAIGGGGVRVPVFGRRRLQRLLRIGVLLRVGSIFGG